jgi:hypothetical protein
MGLKPERPYCTRRCHHHLNAAPTNLDPKNIDIFSDFFEMFKFKFWELQILSSMDLELQVSTLRNMFLFILCYPKTL